MSGNGFDDGSGANKGAVNCPLFLAWPELKQSLRVQSEKIDSMHKSMPDLVTNTGYLAGIESKLEAISTSLLGAATNVNRYFMVFVGSVVLFLIAIIIVLLIKDTNKNFDVSPGRFRMYGESPAQPPYQEPGKAHE